MSLLRSNQPGSWKIESVIRETPKVPLTEEKSIDLSDDDEITDDDDDDQESSESDVAEDTNVTGEISEGNPTKMQLEYESSLRARVEQLEKDIEKMEVEHAKTSGPVAKITAAHLSLLVAFRDYMQQKLEDYQRLIKYGYKQREETLTDEKHKKDSTGTSELVEPIPKQDQEGKCMLNLKPNSASEAEKEMKITDDKNVSRNEITITDEKMKKLQDALLIGDFNAMCNLLGTKNRPKELEKGEVEGGNADPEDGKETKVDSDMESNHPKESEKGELNGGNADPREGKETKVDCDMKSNLGNEEKLDKN